MREKVSGMPLGTLGGVSQVDPRSGYWTDDHEQGAYVGAGPAADGTRGTTCAPGPLNIGRKVSPSRQLWDLARRLIVGHPAPGRRKP
ncbi:hypothetical protein [Nonomuraea sp. KM88]|uniref:hypothetical protein n=1 Tax=Nonomuraea sp. KM88 TaxID=3457427 RepID=UPI003FCC87C7